MRKIKATEAKTHLLVEPNSSFFACGKQYTKFTINRMAQYCAAMEYQEQAGPYDDDYVYSNGEIVPPEDVLEMLHRYEPQKDFDEFPPIRKIEKIGNRFCSKSIEYKFLKYDSRKVSLRFFSEKREKLLQLGRKCFLSDKRKKKAQGFLSEDINKVTCAVCREVFEKPKRDAAKLALKNKLRLLRECERTRRDVVEYEQAINEIYLGRDIEGIVREEPITIKT